MADGPSRVPAAAGTTVGGGGGSTTVEHLLALKGEQFYICYLLSHIILLFISVMRLTRPTMATPLVVPVEDSVGDSLLRGTLSTQQAADSSTLRGLPELCMGQALVLPQSFGNIYLGETFCSYVSLHNDSTRSCTNVALSCDLQTATQRIPLHTTTPTNAEFAPGGSVDKVLSHEVLPLCTVLIL